MIKFTGWQYLLIDCANAFGKDKELFEDRIKWTTDNLHHLESLVDQVTESKPLYIKAVMAIRKAQQGIPTGHLVAFDATCSGIQIMSVTTGCVAGARNTGLIDPNVRADAYTTCKVVMNEILAAVQIVVDISRGDAKSALMTSFYGSKAVPKVIFGEDTPELEAFFEAAATVAPGAWNLLQVLNGSWQAGALQHCWVLPDGFEVKVKVMAKVENDRLEIDELDHASFSYTYKINEGLPKGHKDAKSLPANVTHSLDAYVLRSMHRRCNYDPQAIQEAHSILKVEEQYRALTGQPEPSLEASDEPQVGTVAYYVKRWEATHMADVVAVPAIIQEGAEAMPLVLIQRLLGILEGMLAHKPFEIVTIHDAFACHPNNMNQLRQQYINIMAELAEAKVLDDILSHIHGKPCYYRKLTNNLGDLIRGSNYALC